MHDYIKSFLRVSILSVLAVAAVVLAKPKPAQAFTDCCTNCQNQFQACISRCTGTPLQISICRSACTRQEQTCIEVCPACLGE